MRNNKEYIFVLYFIHITVLLPNIIWWFWDRTGVMVFAMIFAMMENELIQRKY